jgi:hypothetical protein
LLSFLKFVEAVVQVLDLLHVAFELMLLLGRILRSGSQVATAGHQNQHDSKPVKRLDGITNTSIPFPGFRADRLIHFMGGYGAYNNCTRFQTTFRNCSKNCSGTPEKPAKVPGIVPKIFVDEFWRDVFAPIEEGER